VKTCIEKEFVIYWFIGQSGARPPFLPGTDNEMVEAEYDKVGKGPSAISEVIKGRAGKVAPGGEGEKPIKVAGGISGVIPADYFVYAPGPNVAKIRNLFDESSIRDRLTPTYDKNRQFDSDGLSAVLGLEVQNEEDSDQTRLEMIGGTAYRMLMDVNNVGVEDNRIQPEFKALHGIVGSMREDLKAFRKLAVQVPPSKPTGSSQQSPDLAVYTVLEGMNQAYNNILMYSRKLDHKLGRFLKAQTVDEAKVPAFLSGLVRAQRKACAAQFDGEAGEIQKRCLARIWAANRFQGLISDYAEKLIKHFRDGAPHPRFAAAYLSPVIDTLPLNIAMNDQLTPIRSQIEATSAFVPAYIATDVNFATDSSTVLAIHIARNYPKLPADRIHFWVDRIIRERRPSEQDRIEFPTRWGPLPNPNRKPRENAKGFSQRFKKLLRNENDEL
jgi:hypothetical protein